MARNRKRAKERRDRRPQPVAGRSRVGTAQPEASGGMPSPIEHAAPDVELADAQLALGRAQALEDDEASGGTTDQADPAGEGGGGDGTTVGAGFDGGDGAEPPGGGAVGLPGAAGVPEPRARPRARLIGFLEGSWRELQRVQWPDRRQVVQATAVVIGFVIVAGVFLGVADTAASHLMNYILTGK
jgi:preprotein translocase subunit SecE